MEFVEAVLSPRENHPVALQTCPCLGHLTPGGGGAVFLVPSLRPLEGR